IYNPKGERFLIASRFPTPPLACAFFSPGATVTDCSCSKGSVEDRILAPKPPKNCARCAKCGHPVNGPYCQGCSLLREKLEEELVTYFQDTSESSDDNTNVVNAPREPFVVKQDHGVKSSQNSPHIDKCCCECGNALDGIHCQQCICKTCGKGANTGYNCPPKVPIISNPEPCNQTMNNELPQTLPSFGSVPCVSKPNFVDASSNIFSPPPQPPIYSCEFYGSNAQYGHYCTPQAPFNNPEPGFSQDFNFPQNIHDFQQQYLCCDQCGGPHETFQCQQVIFYEPCCENCGGPHENFQCQPKQEEKRIEEEQAANARYWKILACCDDDDDYDSAITPKIPACCDDDDDDDDVDYTIAITPVLSTEEPIDSLSIGDEHLDTIPATESDKVIKSSVEDLVPLPLDVSKDQFKDFSKSNDEFSSTDNDSFSIDNIDYVEASPPDSELVSSEVMEIVILEVGRIDDDILLTIKHDIIREKLLNVNLLITKIEAFNDNPTLSSDCKTKSSSTSLNSLLEETNTFHNSLPEFENFYFDLGEISSGSTTTYFDISLPDYEAFYFDDDHIKEISSGSTTTHSDISLSEYDSFIFDFTHEEFTNELTHIISPPEYDCFYFWNLPDPGELMFVLNFEICENLSSTTRVNLPIKDDYSPLLAYLVWIFLAYLTYPVIPPYLYPFGNEDTIFDPGITINHFYSFKPGLSHRCGAFKKFNTHRSHLNEWLMIINGKNIPILDVLLFHFYPS
nr:hypothetical protein [Tanacetum cinerariifolium]